MKIIHYKLLKVTINALKLVQVILNVVVGYYSLFHLIIFDKSLLFTLKFWLLFAFSLRSNKSSFPLCILKLMVKQSSKIEL